MSAVLATAPDCPHCRDTRIIRHSRMNFIRCTWCTRRKPRLDDSGLRQINEAEAARREQVSIDRFEARQVTGHDAVRSLLAVWGRLVRERGPTYPSMSSHEKARIGRGGGKDPLVRLPPDIEVIDNAVAVAPVDYKAILIEHYTKTGYVNEKAAHLGISRTAYFQRKASAERHIANEIGV